MNNSPFLDGELNQLISTVEQSIIKYPITVEKIIKSIILAGELSNYGYRADVILSSKLMKVLNGTYGV